MIQLWSALGVAVVTVLISPILRSGLDGRLVKRIEAHAKLRDLLKKTPKALDELESLLTLEVRTLREREQKRLTQTVDYFFVAQLVFVGLGAPGLAYCLVMIGLNYVESWGGILIPVAVAVVVAGWTWTASQVRYAFQQEPNRTPATSPGSEPGPSEISPNGAAT